MVRKVYTSVEEMKQQDLQLGTNLPFGENTAVLASPVQV